MNTGHMSTFIILNVSFIDHCYSENLLIHFSIIFHCNKKVLLFIYNWATVGLDAESIFIFIFNHITKEKGDILRLVLFVCFLACPMFLFAETQFYSLDDNVPSLFLRKVVLNLFKVEEIVL